jgi:hypothetical protein
MSARDISFYTETNDVDDTLKPTYISLILNLGFLFHIVVPTFVLTFSASTERQHRALASNNNPHKLQNFIWGM